MDDQNNQTVTLTNTRDKASYSLGFEMGKGLRTQFSDLDIGIFSNALRDAFNNYNPRLNIQEMQEILSAIQNQMVEQQKQFLSKLSHENKQAAEQFLEKNKSEEGVTALSSGLQYQELTEGRDGAHPTAFDSVLIHYHASLLDGTVFESTYEQKEPKKIAVNQMIPGWSEAIKMMTVGDKWRIFVPPYLAYGEQGYPPVIPPNSLLIFEIELLNIG
jgi:FKBP-type peptidyl-prolyl cis-trans isomerase FklB